VYSYVLQNCLNNNYNNTELLCNLNKLWFILSQVYTFTRLLCRIKRKMKIISLFSNSVCMVNASLYIKIISYVTMWYASTKNIKSVSTHIMIFSFFKFISLFDIQNGSFTHDVLTKIPIQSLSLNLIEISLKLTVRKYLKNNGQKIFKAVEPNLNSEKPLNFKLFLAAKSNLTTYLWTVPESYGND
jgi:hypothetical protein